MALRLKIHELSRKSLDIKLYIVKHDKIKNNYRPHNISKLLDKKKSWKIQLFADMGELEDTSKVISQILTVNKFGLGDVNISYDAYLVGNDIELFKTIINELVTFIDPEIFNE